MNIISKKYENRRLDRVQGQTGPYGLNHSFVSPNSHILLVSHFKKYDYFRDREREAKQGAVCRHIRFESKPLFTFHSKKLFPPNPIPNRRSGPHLELVRSLSE